MFADTTQGIQERLWHLQTGAFLNSNTPHITVVVGAVTNQEIIWTHFESKLKRGGRPPSNSGIYRPSKSPQLVAAVRDYDVKCPHVRLDCFHRPIAHGILPESREFVCEMAVLILPYVG